MNMRTAIDAVRRDLSGTLQGGCADCRTWPQRVVVTLPGEEPPTAATCARCGRPEPVLHVVSDVPMENEA